MRRPNAFRRGAGSGLGLVAVALLSLGADEGKQTIDARGLTFEAPKSWKSSPPASSMRSAELKAEPLEGDDYPAELIVFAFPGGAGTAEANIQRWRSLFKDADGNPPRIETSKVKGKNVEVVRAETHGEYHPAQFPGRPAEPVRKDARLLGAIIMGDNASYYIRMVGPDKTMTKIRPEFDEMLKTIEIKN
jgi:hypothetical protein